MSCLLGGVVVVNMSLFISTLTNKRMLLLRIFQIIRSISLGYTLSMSAKYNHNSLSNDIDIL